MELNVTNNRRRRHSITVRGARLQAFKNLSANIMAHKMRAHNALVTLLFQISNIVLRTTCPFFSSSPQKQCQ